MAALWSVVGFFAPLLVLIYILVVGWFQSFKTPVTIMAAISFSGDVAQRGDALARVLGRTTVAIRPGAGAKFVRVCASQALGVIRHALAVPHLLHLIRDWPTSAEHPQRPPAR